MAEELGLDALELRLEEELEEEEEVLGERCFRLERRLRVC